MRRTETCRRNCWDIRTITGFSRVRSIMQSSPSACKHVGIIGGGAAGVITAKCLREAGHSVVVFDKAADVGGVWKYEDAIHSDASMYKSLRTNLPTSVMQLEGMPFPKGTRSFPPHTDVLAYIQNYASHYHVTEHVRFNSTVTEITKNDYGQASPPSAKWKMKISSLDKGDYEEAVDKVLICNGHFAAPFYSTITGIEHFKGTKLHSHDYRTPDEFRNKRVLLVGKGPSGQDISLELVRAGAKEVIVSYRQHAIIHPTSTADSNESRVLKPGIERFTESGDVVFTDGSSITAPDVLMYCTGYLYTVKQFLPPYLLYPEACRSSDDDASMALDDIGASSSSDLITAARESHVLAPLYKQVFSIEEPDFAFIGLPFKNLPFVCFELQAKWIGQVFEASSGVCLPSKKEMYKEFVRDVSTHPFSLAKLHQLGELQAQYFRDIGAFSDSKLDPNVQAMFQDAGFLRSTYPLHYREAEYARDSSTGHWVRRILVPVSHPQANEEAMEELVRVFTEE